MTSNQSLLQGESRQAETAARSPPARLHETPQYLCGEQRARLRQQFNTQEISAAKLIRKYDRDGNKALDLIELRRLLGDYNDSKGDPQDDEVDFICKVADLNKDGVLCQDELLFGMRAWFAFQRMPKLVGAAFTRYNIGNGPMPSDEALKEMLLTLNESQHVSDEEVKYVKETAGILGATEDFVSVLQMRQAVAAWYLNIERGETPKTALAVHAMTATKNRLLKVDSIQLLMQGQCDYTGRGTIAIVSLVVFFFLLMPLVEIWLADILTAPFTCEHPHLDAGLWWTGVMKLVQALIVVLFATISRVLTVPLEVKMGFAITFLVAVIVMAMMYIFGIAHVLASTPTRCGFTLWHICHWVYLDIPIFCALVFCCGVPCMFCCMGSRQFLKEAEIDQNLNHRAQP